MRSHTEVQLVVDVPAAMIELLYIRSAWGLKVAPNMPDPTPRPEQTRFGAPESEDEERWVSAWTAATEGPSQTYWREMHGLKGIDDAAMSRWVSDVRARLIDGPIHRYAAWTASGRPERLESARRAGVHRVVVLPLDGGFSESPAAGVLIVSAATLEDDDDWSEALKASTRPSEDPA